MQSETKQLFPEIEPFNKDWLQTDTLHQIYYEECGNPAGSPVVFLHGGPGSGCNPGQRRFFDPAHYRIILFDQRGCGRSKPQGELSDNHTDGIIADIEALREHLSIDKWHVFGGSWGSTLALRYATQFPEKVISLSLRGIFLSRQSELNWFLGDIQYFYPDVWQTLISYLPKAEQDDVLTAFEKRIASDDINTSYAASEAWNQYEGSIMRLDAGASQNNNEAKAEPTLEQMQTEVARARVQIHYIRHQCFVDGEAILAACNKLSEIPTVIVQGRYDMVCPPQTSWLLSKAMPHAEYIIVPDAGHSSMEPGVISALVNATESFKAL